MTQIEIQNKNLRRIFLNLLDYIDVCRKNDMLPSENFVENMKAEFENAINEALPEYRYETVKIVSRVDKNLDAKSEEKIVIEKIAEFLVDNHVVEKTRERYPVGIAVDVFRLDVRVKRKKEIFHG